MKPITVLTILLTFLLSSFSLSVIGADLEDQVREISNKLRCPTCQALSVKDSDAGLSLNMKSKIREMLKDGKSEEEILRFFEERYGEWILRSPKKEGFNLLLWFSPAFLIIVIGVVLFRSILKRKQQFVFQEKSPLSQKEKEQVEKDLQQLESDL